MTLVILTFLSFHHFFRPYLVIWQQTNLFVVVVIVQISLWDCVLEEKK